MSDFDVVIEFAKFWEAYDKKALDITSSRKGVQSKCLDTYKKYVKTQVKADLLLFALIEQKKHYRKTVDMGLQKPGYFPGANPWLNGRKWEQELDDIDDLKRLINPDESHPYTAKELDKCNVEGCHNEVHGKKYNQCVNHIAVTNEFKSNVIGGLKKNGLMKMKSETREEWIGRLRNQIDIDINRMKERTM